VEHVHLHRILKSYAHYFNEMRTHLALEKDVPSLVRFGESVWSGYVIFWADFITTTSGIRFSVHDVISDDFSRRSTSIIFDRLIGEPKAKDPLPPRSSLR